MSSWPLLMGLSFVSSFSFLSIALALSINPCLLLQLSHRRIHVKRARGHALVVLRREQERLPRHVVVVVASYRKRRWNAVERVIVVILLRLFILVVIQRIAPLERAPNRQMRLPIKLDRRRVVLAGDHGNLV